MTACSHIFCAKCAQGWFAKSSECPCCRKVVDRARLKHVRADLNPGEAAMMLWGLTPQQIMEITKSAIGFFDYQKKQEVAWLMHQIGVREKKLHQCQNQFKAQFVEMKNRFNTLKVARESDRSEFQRAKEAYKTLHENYQDKCRQLRKFEQLYNNLRQSQDGGGQPLNAFSPSSVPGANEVFAVPSASPSQMQQRRERRRLTAGGSGGSVPGGGVAGAPGMMTPPSPSSVASLSPAPPMRAPSSSMRRSSGSSNSSFRAPLRSPSPSGVSHNPFRTPRGIRAGGMPGSSSRGSTPRLGSGGSSRTRTPSAGGTSSGAMSMSSLGVTPRRRRRKHSSGGLGGTPGASTPSLSSMFKRRARR